MEGKEGGYKGRDGRVCKDRKGGRTWEGKGSRDRKKGWREETDGRVREEEEVKEERRD